MWTAQLSKKEMENGLLKLYVEFSNGKDNITETFSVRMGSDNPDFLKNQILEKIAILDKTYTYADSLVLGGIDLTAATAKGAVVQENERETFLHALDRYREFKRLVDEGIVAPDDADFIAMQNNVKSLYKFSYF